MCLYLKTILGTLHDDGWRVKSGDFKDDYFLIIAKKKYKSKRFISRTECHLGNEDIIYVQHQNVCGLYQDDKYVRSLELVNEELF